MRGLGKGSLLFFTILLASFLLSALSACGNDNKEETTTQATTTENGERTSAPDPSTQDYTGGEAMDASSVESTGGQEEDKGNFLRMVYFAAVNLDPAFSASISDEIATRLFYDHLVYLDEDFNPDPKRGLAEGWESNLEETVWMFKLRRGVKFHDGKDLTSRDVKYTFDRLRDPDIGSASATLYENIVNITTPDDITVVFELLNPNPDFLKDLFDSRALIIDADNEDPATVFNGAGPFMVERYIPLDRIVYKRNPYYWMYDDDGAQAPYLDGIEFVFLDDQSEFIEALLNDRTDFVMSIPPEYVPALDQNPDITVYRKLSNDIYTIRMRSDRGFAESIAVRQALKAGTDRRAIMEAANSGIGEVGRDTPIGPVYGDFYLDVPEPARDVGKARQLLSDAGYSDGFDITLYTQQFSVIPQIAKAWKEQMAEIGVNVDILEVPREVYFGEDSMWMEVDFAITNWGTRPYPQPYLDLAYTTDAPWNETHWSDARLDELAAEAATEVNTERRVELYYEIQRIFIEEGPIIVPFFNNNIYAVRSRVKGVKPHSGMAVDYRFIYLEGLD